MSCFMLDHPFAVRREESPLDLDQNRLQGFSISNPVSNESQWSKDKDPYDNESDYLRAR